VSNFNKVFLVVKKRCLSQKHIAEISCFEAIAKETDIPVYKLPVYLSHLQDLGILKYSLEEKYIRLTSFGAKQMTLVKDDVAEEVQKN
jgi:hypothetical protein